MALGKLQKYAKIATKKEVDLLDSLEDYYRGRGSLVHAAETVNIPARALMDYMQKHKLPYYSDASDAEEGLKRISEIRSAL